MDAMMMLAAVAILVVAPSLFNLLLRRLQSLIEARQRRPWRRKMHP
jgi:hypothetical protein